MWTFSKIGKVVASSLTSSRISQYLFKIADQLSVEEFFLKAALKFLIS